MKAEEVTLRVLLQFTSLHRFSLAPANSDEVTLLAVNRRVASSNLARGANLRFFSHLNAARTFGPLPKGRWFKSSLCNQLFFPVNEFPGTLQPSEFLGEFVQADGSARLPVTPLNPGSVKLRRTFLMSRRPHVIARF